MTSKNNIACPQEYAWCATSPKMYVPQIIIGTILLSVGYPFVMVFTSSMYSKILGPRPQGIMQSLYGATGGTARIIAPLLVTYMYVGFGPLWTFISVDSLILMAILLFMLFCKRLTPYHLYVLDKNKHKYPSGVSDVVDVVGDVVDVVKPVMVDTRTVAVTDEMPELRTNTRVVLRIEQYVSRANRWSLIDRSSFYSPADTIL